MEVIGTITILAVIVVMVALRKRAKTNSQTSEGGDSVGGSDPRNQKS